MMINALVIDDNRLTADSLCQLLTLLEVSAQPAYGPRAAMMALTERVPDIVFLDINMPGVSGFEVLAYLRREPRYVDIPVVVVTADDDRATAKRAQKGGAIAVIIKPATFESLEDALHIAKLA
jgi:CheY-like chemotaxis protein